VGVVEGRDGESERDARDGKEGKGSGEWCGVYVVSVVCGLGTLTLYMYTPVTMSRCLLTIATACCVNSGECVWNHHLDVDAC